MCGVGREGKEEGAVDDDDDDADDVDDDGETHSAPSEAAKMCPWSSQIPLC